MASVAAVGGITSKGSVGHIVQKFQGIITKADDTAGGQTPSTRGTEKTHRTQDSIRHLHQLLASAKTTEAEDELALASIDACLSIDRGL